MNQAVIRIIYEFSLCLILKPSFAVKQIKCDVPSRAELEKIQAAVEDSHKGRDGKMDLTSIEKQRRGWEEAREKAEEMSQIFDSLIITSMFTFLTRFILCIYNDYLF